MIENHRKTILVVEDEVIVAFDIEQHLSAQGYTIVGTSVTGEDALAKAEQLQPDVILMDIRLKGEMNGIQAAEMIRSRIDTSIIFITAQSDPVTREQVLSKGYAGYVEKPFDFETLLSAIDAAGSV